MITCRIITIATSTGACAEEIGFSVAKQLGFRYVNEDVISRAAKKARVSPDDVDKVEHTRPLAERILKAMSAMNLHKYVDTIGAEEFYGSTPVLQWYSGPTVVSDTTPLFRNLIREVLWEIGLEGNVVLVAHGGGISLAGMEGLLRVFVTASPETRAARLAAAEHISEREAKKRIDHTDHERQAYLRSFYELKRELPTHYDLVLNTDVLSTPAAVQTIVGAAAAMASEPAGVPA